MEIITRVFNSNNMKNRLNYVTFIATVHGESYTIPFSSSPHLWIMEKKFVYVETFNW